MKVLSENEESGKGECNGENENEVEEIALQGLRRSWLTKECLVSDFLSYLTEYQG